MGEKKELPYDYFTLRLSDMCEHNVRVQIFSKSLPAPVIGTFILIFQLIHILAFRLADKAKKKKKRDTTGKYFHCFHNIMLFLFHFAECE